MRMKLANVMEAMDGLKEMGEEVFIMKENPTAENIAKLIFGEARARGLPVVAIRLWETPHAFAEYREEADS